MHMIMVCGRRVQRISDGKFGVIVNVQFIPGNRFNHQVNYIDEVKWERAADLIPIMEEHEKNGTHEHDPIWVDIPEMN